jgi:glycosyltransferase involved in cell wall biosynthesis
MKKASVSVIMPCFNHARFLEERIRSVLDQTYPVDQIVFLDDASTDGSADLARRLLSHTAVDVHFIENTVNSGTPFHQWNLGVELAQHEIIWITETDDSCDTQFLEVVLERLMEPDTVLSYSQSKLIDEQGNFLYTPDLNGVFPEQFERDFVMDGLEFRNRFLSIRNMIPNASGVVFRKDAFLRAGMANTTMKNCGDWDMWARMAQFGNFSYTSFELNYFRSHNATTRVPGFKAHATAETIAILYYTTRLVDDSNNNSITIPILFRAILTKKLLNGLTICRQHGWDKIDHIIEQYLKLRRVPRVSTSVWIVMALSNYLYRKIRRLFRLGRMLTFSTATKVDS